MDWLFDDGPIIACSTGRTEHAGLGVLRLSGFSSLKNLKFFFSVDIEKVSPRKATLCKLVDDKKEVDQVLITYFPSPNSFTGENLLEVSCHGNQFLISRILELFTKKSSFRLAEPGEFSYRAYRNNKLSLSQVEGLDLVLNSSSQAGISQGLKLLDGELHEQYGELHDLILRLRGAVELAIDFSEDVGDEQSRKLIEQTFADFKRLVIKLYSRTQGGGSSLSKPSVVLAGPTNAGKSTLFNFLLANERSIVSSRAGTTRDYISEGLYFRGNFYNLIDTAGLRESDDEIEVEGIDRGAALFEKSFFKLFVVNPSDFELREFRKFLKESEVDLVCFTHSDLKNFQNNVSPLLEACSKGSIPFIFCDLSGPIEPDSDFENGPIGPGSDFENGPIGPGSDFESGPIEPGLDFESGPIEPGSDFESGPIEPHSKNQRLKNDILRRVEIKYLKLLRSNPLFVDRQRLALTELNQLVSRFSLNEPDMAVLSHNINELSRSTERLIGIISPDDVLSSIFSNFCIGK